MTVSPELYSSESGINTLALGSVASEWPGHSHIFTPDSPLPAVRIEGMEQTSPELQSMVLSQIGGILGIEIDEPTFAAIKDKVGTGVSSLFTCAGWGHSYEAYMMALGFIQSDIPVVYGQADGIVEEIDEKAYGPYAQKIEAHKAVQIGEEVYKFLKDQGLADGVAMQTKAHILSVFFGLEDLADGSVDANGVAAVNVPLEGLLPYRLIYRQLLKGIQQLNYRLSDKAIGKVIGQFMKELGVSNGYSANPPVVQGLNKKRNNIDVVASHVDVGYPRGPDGRFNPGPSVEFVSVSRDQLTVVPDQVTAGIVNDYYGHKKTMWVGDNVGPIDIENHLGKWADTSRKRKILLSTSGHGANADELSKMVDQYLEYQSAHPDSPYTCVVFVGDHLTKGNNAKINDLIEKVRVAGGQEFQASWRENIEEFESNVRAAKGLVLVGTEDMIQTARVKNMLQNEVHVEAVKSGESHTMNPHHATATYLLKPAPPNEPFNGIYALTRGGSFARHPIWRDYLHNYYKNQGLTDEQINVAISQIPGLEKDHQEENFFDELDLNFESGRIREEAMRGVLNITNSIVPTMALVIANALGIELDEVRRREIQARIAEYHTSERVRKQALIENLYSGITEGFSNRQEEEYQRLTPEHSLVAPTAVGIGILVTALAFALRKKRKIRVLYKESIPPWGMSLNHRSHIRRA